MRYLTIMLPMLFVFNMNAQSAHKHKRAGDLMYDQGEFTVAEEEYRKANSIDESSTGTFNLGNTIYRQERFDEAVSQYEKAAQLADSPEMKSGAYYNLGNTYMQAQQFDKGVEAYIEALKVNPNDIDTKKNLTLALQKMQQQQQQQQQEQQEGEEGDDEEEQEQEQQQGQQNDEPQQDESEPQKGEEQQEELSKEEAEQLLRIVEAEDQKVQEKLRKSSGDQRKPKKDW